MNHASSGRATLARNTNGTHQREAKDRRRNRGLTLCVAILAAVLIAVMVAAPQRAKGEELKNEAEAMTLSGSSVLVHSDDTASGGQNVAYFTEGSVSMPFSGELTGVNLRARETTNCVGNPKLLVLVDGLEKGTIIVTSSTYGNYPLSISGVGAGSHQLRIVYINDRVTKKCDRNAYLDYVTLTITDVTVTPLQTTIDSGPSDTLSSNSANFAFSSTEPDSTFECKLDDAAFASCSSPQGYTNLSEGAHTFSVRATDAAGNTDATPASRTWSVDTTAPSVSSVTPTGGATDVALTTGATATFSEPVDASTITASNFALKKQGATTSVATSIGYDGPTKKATLTPNSDLEAGATYTATVQGGPGGVKDVAGNALAQDEVWSFTTAQAADTAAPDPPVFNNPQDNSFDTDGNVTVSGTAEPGSTVEIFDGTTSKGTTQADGSGDWSKTLTGVAEGSHSYTAKATDAAGKVSAASNTRTVTVDTAAPDTTIDAKPASSSNNVSPSFGFSSSEANSTFECKLDAGSFAACTSPKTITGLADGSHTFQVRATDTAGNTDASPATYTWAVDTTAPAVVGLTPANGATDVAVGTSVEATLSEGVDQTTLNQGTFSLVKQGTTTPVTATVSYDTQAKKAILKPNSVLVEGSTYSATIKGGTSGVKDTAGNPLATDKIWSFTTTAALPLPPPSAQTNPFAGQKFYINPNSNAKKTEDQWRAAGRTADADQMHKIAANPDIFYFSEWTLNAPGGTSGHVDWQTDQIYAQGALPVYGVYAVPHRDCGAYSSGGFTTGDQYKTWINDVVAGLQGRKAVFIVEPDGIASTDCLSSAQLQERFDLIHYAVNKIEAEGSAAYIDGSNCFAPDGFISDRLKLAGIADAHGFSRNVSNFCYTSSEIQHGTTISNAVGGKHFIIDTSRNGLGPYLGANNWCNPPGRALGPQPTSNTGNTLVDVYYWLKRPGESDGSCNGYPGAGTWLPDYALELAKNAAY